MTKAILSSPEGYDYILVSAVLDEFDESRLTESGQSNWTLLQQRFTEDDTRYFTIGVSAIGGPDILAGGNGYSEIRREVADTQAAFSTHNEERERQGKPPLDSRQWLNRNQRQADASIFSLAERLGCDVLVTTNLKDFKAVDTGQYNCRIVSLADFLNDLKTSLPD
jgi:hypothetical protein